MRLGIGALFAFLSGIITWLVKRKKK